MSSEASDLYRSAMNKDGGERSELTAFQANACIRPDMYLSESKLEQCHSPPHLRWGIPIEKAVSGEYNLPIRIHGRADDEVIDQLTLFKRHV
jgi:hypothetical protein